MTRAFLLLRSRLPALSALVVLVALSVFQSVHEVPSAVAQPQYAMIVSPTSLTIPVGSRACYIVYPSTDPTSGLNVAHTLGTGLTGKATVTKSNITTWGFQGGIYTEFCVKGVAETSSPGTITHTVTAGDTNYNGITVPSVSVTVTAADTKPVVRFLHSDMRVVEGDTNREPIHGLSNLWIREYTVKLDIAPAPSSDGKIRYYFPSPSAGAANINNWSASGDTARWDTDFLAASLSYPISLTSGSNDAEFTFTVRADNEDEDDETVRVYLVAEYWSPSVAGGIASNTDVCIGSCSSPTRDQQSMVITIIDDDNSTDPWPSYLPPKGTQGVSGGGGVPDPEPTAVSLSLSSATASESAGDVTLTATLDAPAPDGGISLALGAEQDNTATRNTDYTMPASIGIPAGSRSGTATISIIDDEEDEDDETVGVNVFGLHTDSNGVGHYLVDIATLTIVDDDTTTDGQQVVGNSQQQQQEPQQQVVVVGQQSPQPTQAPSTPTPEPETETQETQLQHPQVPSNRAPTVASPLSDVSGLAEGATKEVSLSGVFSDADGDALTITASSDYETVATVTVASDGSALTLSGVSSGDATITVVAQDPDGAQSTTTFKVEVVDAPQDQEHEETSTPDPTPTPEPKTQQPQPASEPEKQGDADTPTSEPETETSSAVARYDANGDGSIDLSEYSRAANDYIDGKITYSEMVEVATAYRAS